jgi:hypothetical protein
MRAWKNTAEKHHREHKGQKQQLEQPSVLRMSATTPMLLACCGYYFLLTSWDNTLGLARTVFPQTT